MSAAIQDVHHRDGEHMREHAAQVAVERQPKRAGGRLGNSQAGAQDGIGSQRGFVRCAVQLQQQLVDGFLFNGIPTNELVRNLIIDMVNRVQNALAAIAGFIAVAQFQRFMYAGRSARRYNRAAITAVS